MKRVFFIIFWIVVFTILTVIVGTIAIKLLGYLGLTSWSLHANALIGMSWALIFWGMPVLGLILGIFGKLPGTKRVRNQANFA